VVKDGKDDWKLCRCGGEFRIAAACGVWTCNKCDNHHGIGKCFCGWSAAGGRRDKRKRKNHAST